MSSVSLILAGLAVIAASGLPACLMPRRSASGQRLTVALFLAGSLAGITGTVLALGQADAPAFSRPWALPWGQFSVSVDTLSAFFLLLVFTVPALGSIYSLGYWKQSEHGENGQRLGVFYGLLAGSMAMVVIARDSALFLIVWEIMALSAYFAATAEDDKPEVRQAGWVYLVATHMGTLLLIAMFGLWRKSTGSFALDQQQVVTAQTAGMIFGLAVAGFGFKAGLMPLHVWLPGAHANAPSHVSAVMSGVMLKMGIYGILRISALLPPGESWWGILLLSVGAITGILAIAFALGQRDIKRLLAYSSIENIGIIAMGMGLALLGRSTGRYELVLLGMGGALLHVWNHGLFKSLLFFNSGSIIHAAHGRDMETMGGLAKKMPLTALMFVVGAVAISALPPLNGFASEWLLYLGMFRSLEVAGGGSNLALAGLAAVALAMIGALAVATFVKIYGTVFLGSERSSHTEHAHDASLSMNLPMVLLAGLCLAIGLFPMALRPLLEKAVRAWAPETAAGMSLASLAPQAWISSVGIGLLAAITVLGLYMRLSSIWKKPRAGITWDCGYSRPTARMQYTGTSFAQILVSLFAFIARPTERRQEIKSLFPAKKAFTTAVPDTVLDRLVLPVFRASNKFLPRVYFFQQGQTYLYVLYILAITMGFFILGGMGAGL